MRREVVLCITPLSGQVRAYCLKGVALADTLAVAIWTACACLYNTLDCGLPLMWLLLGAFVTCQVHLLLAATGKSVWVKVLPSIALPVP